MRMYFLLLVSFLSLNFISLSALNSVDSSSNIINESVSITPPISIDLLNEHNTIQPGRPFWIAIRFDLAEGWHCYWKNPGDAGMPAMIEWNLPEGFTVSSIEWPVPQKFTQDSLIGYGYDDTVLLLAEIIPNENLKENQVVKIAANIEWLACSDNTCLPGEQYVEKTLKAKLKSPKVNPKTIQSFAEARKALPQKHEAISVQRKDGFLHILLEGVENEHISKAVFFPDNNDIFDHHTEVNLSKTSEGVELILKDPTSNSKVVKGVLVLKSDHQTVKALDIDSLVQNQKYESNEIAMNEGPVSQKSLNLPLEAEHHESYAMVLLFAFIGGAILNLMPCVLPVLSFKVLSFVKMAGQKRSLTFKHGLAFSLGVLVSFWVLASILLILQTYGRSVGWGFQLQEPLFVAILASLLFVFGLSLFGIMELGTSMTTLAGKQKRSDSLLSSFFSGVLATAVATPCTGPFLGSAVGYAVTLSAPMALLIFTFIGLGMAIPYLLLSAFPSLLRFMPKPGHWMVAFKEIMGFLMMATVLWLVWVFGAETSETAIILLLISFFFLSLGSWIFGKWGSPLKKKATRYTSYAFVSFSLLAASYFIWNASKLIDSSSHIGNEISDSWEEFSPERVAELQSQGTPVFIDFTAKWCLSCQVNHAVLAKEDVSSKFEEMGVVRMKADWTKKDAIIAGELRKFGRNSVPLYVLYGKEPNKNPKILPQVLTTDTIINELDELKIH